MKEPTCFYASTLKERGWSEKLIQQLLGEPDEYGTNPHYKSGPPTRLFLRERVFQAEETPSFQTHIEKREQRVESAKKAVQTKSTRLTERISQVEINLPKLTEAKLITQAISQYNRYRGGIAFNRGDGDFTPVVETRIRKDKLFIRENLSFPSLSTRLRP